MKLEDQNTQYFHNTMKARRAHSKIMMLTLVDGTITSDDKRISDEMVYFHKNLLGTLGLGREHVKLEVLCVDLTVSDEDIALLNVEVTNDEIKSTLLGIDGKKALGFDGFNSTFFKKNWQEVWGLFSKAILEFFSSGKMLKQVNATSITIILKSSSPAGLGDCRLIACCKVIYKAITKILAARLSKILPGIIHLNQSTFIPGRNVVDNILMAYELVKNYHLTANVKARALKIDLRKAYDSVHWDFVEEFLMI